MMCTFKSLNGRFYKAPRGLSQFAMKVNLDLFDLSKSKEVLSAKAPNGADKQLLV